MSLKKRSKTVCFTLVNLFTFLLFVTQSFGQQVQSVIPASPTIGTLKQFNDYPMDYSTGTTNISVPIHTISTKNFSIPINMSFNARGRMGSLNYSPLGVGWGLTCIDYITREINGKADEYATPIQQTKESLLDLGSGTDYNNRFHELYEKIIRADPDRPTYDGNAITYPSYDIIPDIYSFKVNGRSGKYIVDLDDHVVPLSYSTLKFNAAMEVMDESGNQFYFGTTPSAVENTTTANIGYQSQNLPSAWYLTQILTAAGETITYNYESIYTGTGSGPILPVTSAYNMYTYVKKLSALSNLAENPLSNATGANTENVSRINPYVIALLKSIVYPTGKVEFFYSSTDKKLESIKVFNTSSQIVKTVEFTYINTAGTDYLPNNNSISLSNMKIKGKNNLVEEQYNFEYYNEALNYSSSTNYQQSFLNNVDWWGYCNFNGARPPVIPDDNDFTQGQNGSKDPSEHNKLNGMLKKIVYPTGGFTEFTFESNKCFSNGNSGTEIIDGPGLRIKEIKSSSGNGAPTIKKITYATGTLPYIPSPYDFRSELTFSAYTRGMGSSENSHYLKKTYTPFPASYVSKLYSMPVFYNFVTEAQYSESGQALGKTEYLYEGTSSTTVTEDNYLKHVAVKEWTESRLKEKKIYKSVGTTGYSIQEHSSLQYMDLNYVNVPGINFIRKVDLWYYFDPSLSPEPSGSRSGTTDEELFARNNGLGSIYTIINRPIESAISVVSSEQVTKYEDGGHTISSTKNYEYNNLLNVLPTKETTTGSDGKLRVSEFKYTSDVAAIGNVYSDMVSSRNMVKNLIDQTDFVGGTQTNYVRTNYYSPHTNLFVPQNIVLKKGNGPIYNLIDFKRYNTKGGVLEQQKSGEPNEVYFWGYQEQFTVAKIIGSDYTTALTKLTQAQINTETGIASNDANVQTLLNNLRTLSGSMVSTFTYDPLIGMTSQSDVNNRVTYFEYDSFNRLKNIRDNEHNILKRYEYAYTDQNVITSSNLNALVDGFRQIESGRMNSFFHPSDILRAQSIKDTRLIYRDGVAQLPEEYRTRPASFYSSLNLNLADPYYVAENDRPRFCFMQDGYAVEWRLKMPANSYNHNVITVSSNFNFMAQFKIINDGGSDGTYLYGYNDFDGNSYGEANGGGDFNKIWVANKDAFNNFQKIKLQVTATKYRVYYNDELIKEYPRTSTTIDNQFYVDAGFLGNDGAVDYVKVYNNLGVVQYQEDFSDPTNPVKPNPSLICPAPANCQTAFTSYFNQTMGTSYNYSQIAALYLEKTGQALSVCN